MPVSRFVLGPLTSTHPLSRQLRSAAAGLALVAGCLLALPQAAVAQAAAPIAASSLKDPVLTVSEKLGEELWLHARTGNHAKFHETLDALAARANEADALATVASTFKKNLVQREETRTKRITEAREELRKLADGEQTDVIRAKSLRLATELQLLSPNKEALMAEPSIVALIKDSDLAARDAEARADIFAAYELFSLLGTLEEESGKYKPDVRRLSQRLDMLRQYVPQSLWRLRNERQKAAGEKELPPYNPYGDDFKTKLGPINQTMVLAALQRVTQHVEQKPVNVLLQGGLDSLRIMLTTKDLRDAFPKLDDDMARNALLTVIENESKLIENSTRYFDLGQVDALLTRILTVNEQAGPQIPSYALLHEFGNGAMSKLDEFTAIIWPDELRRFKKMTESNFVGVGIQIEYDESSAVRVVSPLEGTPAQRAGVHPGDILKKVDGREIFGLSLDQAVDVITGPAGTDVVLSMQRKIEGQKNEDGTDKTEIVDFRLTRTIIKVPSIKGWLRSGVKEDDWNWFIDEKSGIGYMRLTQFVDTSGKEFDDAIRTMRKQGMNGLIFDLRFNPGGLLDQAVRIGRRFIDSPTGFIVAMQGRDGQITSPEETMPDRAILANMPIIVLVNEGSASASEIVSGALQKFQKGGALGGNLDVVIMGARSYGKGSVQNVWGMTQNSMIKVTTQYYTLPDKSILHRRPGATAWGVEPNLTIEMLPKQTGDALLLRRNADIIPLNEKGAVELTGDKTRPDATELLTKGLDLQLEAALVTMKARLAAGGGLGGKTASTNKPVELPGNPAPGTAVKDQ